MSALETVVFESNSVIKSGLKYQGAYSTTIPYSPNDIVSYNSNYYIANIASTNQVPPINPPINAYWKLFGFTSPGNGSDGQSAYQIAVANGYQGTVSEWLETLQGATGSMGYQGIPGIAGPQGPQGPSGAAGTISTDGANGAFNARGGLQVVPSTPYMLPNSSESEDRSALLQNRTWYGYGWNIGSQNFSTFAGWRVIKGTDSQVTNATRGIKQTYGGVMNSFAIGDLGLFYSYANSYPGSVAPADEGIVGVCTNMREWQNRFAASIDQTSGTGDRTPTFKNVTVSMPAIDGGWLINLSKAVAAGNMTASSSNLETHLGQIPITVTSGAVNNGLPLCTGWGHFGDQLAVGETASSTSQSATVSVSVRSINGVASPFVPGAARLLGSRFPEMVMITSVSAITNNQQTLTFNYRYPHESGGYLFQGGLAGTVMSFDANLALSGKRTAHMVGGSVDGQHVIYTIYLAGMARGGDTLPMTGREAANVTDRAGVHFYPAAENTVTLTPPSTMPPSMQLEPNTVPWTSGDLVECVPPVYWGGSAAAFRDFSDSPNHPDYSHSVVSVVGSGYNKALGFSLIEVYNGNNNSIYKPNGGKLDKPYAVRFVGDGYKNLLYADFLPDPISLDNNSAAFLFKNLPPSGSGRSRIFGMPVGNDISYEQDQWFHENEWAWSVTSTLRAKNISAGRITVDGNLTIPGIGPFSGPNDAVNKSYVDQTYGSDNYTGDITVGNVVIHVYRGRIFGIN